MTHDHTEVRRPEGHRVIDAALLRQCILTALEQDALRDLIIDELLFPHIVEGRYHPTVIAGSLRRMLSDLIDAMTDADWQIIINDLIRDARTVIHGADIDDDASQGRL